MCAYVSPVGSTYSEVGGDVAESSVLMAVMAAV